MFYKPISHLHVNSWMKEKKLRITWIFPEIFSHISQPRSLCDNVINIDYQFAEIFWWSDVGEGVKMVSYKSPLLLVLSPKKYLFRIWNFICECTVREIYIWTWWYIDIDQTKLKKIIKKIVYGRYQKEPGG